MRYYRIKFSKKLDRLMQHCILEYPDDYSTNEIAKNIINNVCKTYNDKVYPIFAFEEISEDQMEKEKVKGVPVL